MNVGRIEQAQRFRNHGVRGIRRKHVADGIDTPNQVAQDHQCRSRGFALFWRGVEKPACSPEQRAIARQGDAGRTRLNLTDQQAQQPHNVGEFLRSRNRSRIRCGWTQHSTSFSQNQASRHFLEELASGSAEKWPAEIMSAIQRKADAFRGLNRLIFRVDSTENAESP
jgi:hypothetical protein